MNEFAHDARRLDVARLAAEGGSIAGELSAATVPRLCADAPLPADAAVRWKLAGELRKPASAAPQPWLRVLANAPVVQTCQRCLQPMVLTLSVDRPIRFVADEDEAERLDEEIDDDVLALSPRGLDALALIEDELILALPLVPRHERCPQPLPREADAPAGVEPGAGQAPESPFAALAVLKRPRPDGG
jgi:uncharacterized protein